MNFKDSQGFQLKMQNFFLQIGIKMNLTDANRNEFLWIEFNFEFSGISMIRRFLRVDRKRIGWKFFNSFLSID